MLTNVLKNVVLVNNLY